MSEFEKRFPLIPIEKMIVMDYAEIARQDGRREGWLEHSKLILERIEQGQEDIDIREYLIDEIETIEKE